MIQRFFFVTIILFIQLSFATLERVTYEFGGQVYAKLTRHIVEENYSISLFEEPYDGVSYSIADTAYYFITDAAWHRVIYVRNCEGDQDHSYAKHLGKWGTGIREFNAPHGVALDAVRNVYVVDTDNGRVVKLRLQADTLAWIDEIGAGVLEQPWDLEVEGNKLYVVDASTHKVYRFSLTGNYEISYGGYGSPEGKFNTPKGITVYGNMIYVSDTDNWRIVALQDNGSYIEFVRWMYPDLYENRYLLDIEVDQRGVIYVCDGARSKILKFSPNLTSHIYSFGGYGAGTNQFKHPRGIFIQDTTIAIVEEWTDNSGIQAYKEVVKIKELKTSKQAFDATEQDITISFKIDDFSAGAELTVGDREWNFTNLNPDEEYQVIWDGRHRNDSLFLPGDYVIHLTLSEGNHKQDTVTVKGTIKTGFLSSDEHWTEAGEPYVLNRSVGVNQKLTIDPGVKVMPTDNYQICVYQGRLIAQGTGINKIIFTPHRKLSPQPDPVSKGFWKGFHFSGSTEDDTLMLKHCVIEAAGSDIASIYVMSDTGVINIDYCEITKSSNYGIWLDNRRKCNLNISNSIFEEDSIPARCLFTGTSGFGNGNEYLNNTINKIEIYPCSLRYDMTIKKQEIPYWFRKTPARKNYEVYGDTNYVATLTIEPGTEIEFADSTALEIGRDYQWGYYWYNQRGRLHCEGLEDDTIRLRIATGGVRSQKSEKSKLGKMGFDGRKRPTSGLDKSKHRNENLDTPEEKDTSEDSLFWRGLRFDKRNQPVDTSIIKYTSIEYAGLDTAAIIFGDSTSLSIIDSRIFKSKNYGIWMPDARPYDNLLISNCLFEEDSVPVIISFKNLSGLQTCSFLNNTIDAIEVLAYTQVQVHNDVDIHYQPVPYYFLNRLSYGPTFMICGSQSLATLTIDPGIVIKCDDEIRFLIGQTDDTYRGKIVAQGNESNPIIFTAIDTTKPWLGIHLYSFNAQDTSIFEYCEMSYGWKPYDYLSGHGILGCYCAHTPFILRNSIISHSRGCGFNYNPTGGDLSIVPEIKNNQFIANDSFPIVMPANYLRNMDDNIFINNGMNEILVKHDTRINQSLVWSNQGVPYVIDHQIIIQGSSDTVVTVEIERGNVLKFKQGSSGLRVDSDDRLIARQVIFTKADSQPWTAGLSFDRADTSIIDSCIIEYFWNSNPNYGAIHIISCQMKITNSQIINNSTGIIINDHQSYYSDVEITNNRIILNENGIDVKTTQSDILVKNNDFSGNKCAFISAHAPVYPYTQADSNWWGHASGPWDPSPGLPDSNLTGRGDSIGDYVQYRHWLESPVHEQVVTLIQPNGGEILYAESNYEIQWLIEPGRDLPQILQQELYYTTDFPEGGAREEALWQFIDTVDVNQTNYVWSVASIPSERCRVAIKVYYDTETERWEDWEKRRQGDKEKIKQGIRLSGNQDIRAFENDATRGLVALQNNNSEHKGHGSLHSKNANQGLPLQSLKDEYELRGTSTIAVDISDANFTIVDTVAPQITVTVPNGGEYFIPTKAETIKWQASDNHELDHFNIYFSIDGGINYSQTIVDNLEAPCSTYAWVPSDENSYTCKIKVVAYDSSDNNDNDVSDDLFYIPVKSYSNDMTAYNNARRLVRSFFSILHLVYTTQSESGENKGNQGLAREIEDRNDATRGLAPPIKDERELVALQSNNNKYKGRGTSKVCYIKSTDAGNLWQSPIELGDGIYPSMAMDDDAFISNIIGVAWTNVSGSKVLYKYCNPFGIWSGLYTIFNEASDITYSPLAIQLANDTIHLATLKTTQISGNELVQDVLHVTFPWNNPITITVDTIDHWRIAYDGDSVPRFVSLALDYKDVPYFTWERPPDDTIFYAFVPFDIHYVRRSGGSGTTYNISSSAEHSINPSIDWYGGHVYVVWQEKVNGYNVFLYKRSYVQFPPRPETDTISQTSANSLYPVSRMGGVVLWAEGDPAEIYGRIWDSQNKFWLELENWSNTSEHSMYPQVDAWQSEGSTDIMCNWTEKTDTCGLGQHFVSFFPGREYAEIAFPSYCLTLGDSMSTPFTEYRDTIATYQEDKFDLGIDSLVYYLPYINANAKCRMMIELYRPDTNRVRGKGNKWKIKLDVDGTIQQMINLYAGELKVLQLDIPAAVNMDEDALIKFTKQTGDFILVRRILFYEYERGEEGSGSFLAGGPQNSETMQVSPLFFEGLYPNPAKGNLKIRFNSPDEQKVTVKLYDVSGRLVNEIFNGKAKIGINEMPIMAANYAAGIYFIRIETNKEIITEKFIMLK